MGNIEAKKEVIIYPISNDKLDVGILNFGGGVQYLRFNNGKQFQELCLWYNSVEERLLSNTYCGAVIGRVSNRISNASFTLNDETYKLNANDGKNTLHGGFNGFDRKFFDVYEQPSKDNDYKRAIMHSLSMDGEEGFPGMLHMKVIYELQDNALLVTFKAISNKDTVWAPTLHLYFNIGLLKDIFDTKLQIFADKYTPIDNELLPTGEQLPVENTLFDFRKPTYIGRYLNLNEKEFMYTHGYDHNFVLNGEHAAMVYNEKTGIKVDIYTDMPGLQFYSGNFLKGNNGIRQYKPWEGFALEPQFFPNSVNQDGFLKPVLKANESKTYYIRYEFNNVKHL